MQEQTQAAGLRQEVSRLGSEVSRLQSELNQERGSKEQHASRVATLQRELQQETASLVQHIKNILFSGRSDFAVVILCCYADCFCTHTVAQSSCSFSVRERVDGLDQCNCNA